MIVHDIHWDEVDRPLGFGLEDGSWCSADRSAAGWDEAWESADIEDGGGVKIRVFSRNGWKDGYLVDLDLVSHVIMVWCKHWGEVTKMVNEFQVFVQSDDDSIVKFRTQLLEQLERAANGIWELSSDFDAAFWTFFGRGDTPGVIDRLNQNLEEISSGVISVADNISTID